MSDFAVIILVDKKSKCSLFESYHIQQPLSIESTAVALISLFVPVVEPLKASNILGLVNL